MLHKKALVTLLALGALLALADPAAAACKVKGEGNGTANKIQAAPTKRMTNKLLFDVVAKKKTNATTTDEDDEDDDE